MDRVYREDSNASNFEFRDAANRRFAVSFESTRTRLREHDGTNWTTPDSNNYVLTPGQWYDVKVIVDGGYVEMWCAPQGETLEKLLEVGQTVVQDREQIIFVSSPNSNVRYDNIAFSVPDPEIAAYTYNEANELEKAVANGVATYYTYDAWGRTSSRYQGDGSAIHANYTYRFGDKLKSVTSTFPGEAATMAHNYDGLGRRRNATRHCEERVFERCLPACGGKQSGRCTTTSVLPTPAHEVSAPLRPAPAALAIGNSPAPWVLSGHAQRRHRLYHDQPEPHRALHRRHERPRATRV